MSVLFAPTLIGTSALRTFVEWVVTDAVPTDAGEMSIVFERPVPSWGWFLITLGAVLVGWWSYRRLSGAVRVPTRALRASVDHRAACISDRGTQYSLRARKD